MFNEPQLLLVYRVALEIEMVYGIPNDNEENEDPAQFLNLTGEEHMSMDEGVTIRPEDPANYDPNIEGMERVNIYAKVFSRVTLFRLYVAIKIAENMYILVIYH